MFRRTSSTVPYLKQMNSFNITTPYFLHYIILTPMPKSPKGPLLYGLWPLLCENSHLSQTCYIQDIRLSPSVDNMWRVHLMKLFMHPSMTYSLFLSRGSKYSPQHTCSQTPAIQVFRSGSHTTYHIHTKKNITI
jgi:hypothetical protein